jgi:hypothetical protein
MEKVICATILKKKKKLRNGLKILKIKTEGEEFLL